MPKKEVYMLYILKNLWSGNLAAIVEVEMNFKSQALPIFFVGAVDTILPGMYRYLMFMKTTSRAMQ